MKITAIMALMLVGGIFIGVLAFSALNYILESLAFYTLAKRRGIKAPALAWVPFAKMWTVGKIAEHADNARGIKRKWAITLLVLYVIPIAMILVVYGAIIVLAAMASVEEFLGIDYMFGRMTEAGVLGAIVLAYIIIIVALSHRQRGRRFCIFACIKYLNLATRKNHCAICCFSLSFLLRHRLLYFPVGIMTRACRKSPYRHRCNIRIMCRRKCRTRCIRNIPNNKIFGCAA